MRVLLINHFPLQGSGSGIYTLNIAKELVGRGHKVCVLDVDNRIDETNYEFDHETIMFGSEDADLTFNFPCFTTHPRSINTFYHLSNDEMKAYIDTFIKRTKEIVKTFKPDVIHAQHLWIAPYAASLSGVPFVVTAHGTDLMGFKKDERYQKYAVDGSEKATFVIAISKQVYNDTIRLYHPKKAKIIIVPNGFDEKIFRAKNEKKEDVLKRIGTNYIADKIISFVGKFTDFKGIDILIKSAVIVNKVFPDTAFYLAGDGGLCKDMEKLANDLGLKNIIFLGHQSQEDVASLYGIADLSVVPSRIEPFGLVAIEALACGTPVVATNAGGLPDFINEKVGTLVEMNNSDALANGIIKELNGKSKFRKGKYAAQYALQNYSWNSNLGKVIELYQKTLYK